MRTGWGWGVVGAVLALGITGATPAMADETVPAPLWKLARGVTNLVFGFPFELFQRTGSRVTNGEESGTAGGAIASLFVGGAEGAGYGILRVGSGLVDVVTFPVPFDDRNRPLLEPEFIF